jgi:hypothetical protein
MTFFIRLKLWLKNIKCTSKCCETEDHHDIIINVKSENKLHDKNNELKETIKDSPINIIINSRM